VRVQLPATSCGVPADALAPDALPVETLVLEAPVPALPATDPVPALPLLRAESSFASGVDEELWPTRTPTARARGTKRIAPSVNIETEPPRRAGAALTCGFWRREAAARKRAAGSAACLRRLPQFRQ
jgi:hypothetical protein